MSAPHRKLTRGEKALRLQLSGPMEIEIGGLVGGNDRCMGCGGTGRTGEEPCVYCDGSGYKPAGVSGYWAND